MWNILKSIFLLHMCMTGGCSDLNKLYAQRPFWVCRGCRAERIARSQRYAVSGCKQLQLDSTPSLLFLLHNLICSSPVCSARNRLTLIAVVRHSVSKPCFHVFKFSLVKVLKTSNSSCNKERSNVSRKWHVCEQCTGVLLQHFCGKPST